MIAPPAKVSARDNLLALAIPVYVTACVALVGGVANVALFGGGFLAGLPLALWAFLGIASSDHYSAVPAILCAVLVTCGIGLAALPVCILWVAWRLRGSPPA